MVGVAPHHKTEFCTRALSVLKTVIAGSRLELHGCCCYTATCAIALDHEEHSDADNPQAFSSPSTYTIHNSILGNNLLVDIKTPLCSPCQPDPLMLLSSTATQLCLCARSAMQRLGQLIQAVNKPEVAPISCGSTCGYPTCFSLEPPILITIDLHWLHGAVCTPRIFHI